MLQMIALILVSPTGVSVIRDVVYAALIVSDCDECGFNDLGKLLFGGLVVAIIVGVAVPLWLRRLKRSRPEESQFVSINVTGAEKRTDAR
jgi:hypothetical protein